MSRNQRSFGPSWLPQWTTRGRQALRRSSNTTARPALGDRWHQRASVAGRSRRQGRSNTPWDTTDTSIQARHLIYIRQGGDLDGVTHIPILVGETHSDQLVYVADPVGANVRGGACEAMVLQDLMVFWKSHAAFT